MSERSAQPSPASNDLPFQAGLLATFLCMLFGANPIAVKVSLGGIGIFTTAGLRFAIAAAILLTWALITKRPLRISWKQVRQMIVLALIFYVQISIFYYGQSKTTASHGALIGNLLPFIVMLLAHFFLKNDRITSRKVVGLLCGFSGVVLLFLHSLELSGQQFIGDCILVVAVCVWGCNATYVKKISNDYHPVQLTLYPMIFALPLYFFSGYLFDGQMIRELNPSIYAGMLYQSVVTASFGFVLWNSLIRQYGATALHSFIFIMPISGVLLGVILLDEPFTTHILGSIVMVSVGLITVNYAPGKRVGLL